MANTSASVLEEMFSDARDSRERGDRFEALKSAFDESITRHDKRIDAFIPAARRANPDAPVGIIKNAGPGAPRRTAALEAAIERINTVSKGLDGTAADELKADLAALQALKSDLSKDISTTVPGNLHPYDLEGPAKQLVPRFTPLRNDIPRQKGIGTAREYRRILGYTNTGMGGVADQTPFFNSETALNGGSTTGLPSFGALQLIRGQKISYAMDVHTVPYMEMSLSASTGWKAQFANLGFENNRALDQMALLWAHLIGEEKAILWGRGGAPYAGAVAAPSGTPTLASGGTAIGSGFGTTAFVKVTSYTGMGESLPSTEATNASLTAGQALVITLPGGAVSGALAYGVYASTTTGTETFQGYFLPQAGGTNAGKLVVSNYVTGGRVVPAADGSFNANAYDGLITTLISGGSGPSGGAGYVGFFPTLYASAASGASVYGGPGYAGTNVGDAPWQNMFAAMYANNYADPEEAWVTAVQRRQFADWVRSSTTGASAYRITMGQSEFDGSTTVGGYVSGMANESSPTDRIVDLRVHPYMPSGVSFARTRHLPIPDSGIGETNVITEVQGYMSVDWPEMQFTYDSSTYWYGTLLHYAPAWSGIIYGLQ
ncbi:hypothetical protein EAS64_33855 [Trebonia kvetii]|uniref:Uncharacterized protein n=1 Tax=Trebonia kvetii TaxID=2480626 RepID=A0A6P2BSR5_9ACTN|nr:hypothetical protein [Trebonia kvetii]TVZ01266.1 hypothetical protein EAS64_33855 [Trebonia kvetii]